MVEMAGGSFRRSQSLVDIASGDGSISFTVGTPRGNAALAAEHSALSTSDRLLVEEEEVLALKVTLTQASWIMTVTPQLTVRGTVLES